MKNVSEPLIACGVKRTTAMVVKCLVDNKQHSLYQIERTTGLRQPEVNIAVKALLPFLTVTNKSGERGRPQKIVCLTKNGLSDYVASVVKTKHDAIEMLANIV